MSQIDVIKATLSASESPIDAVVTTEVAMQPDPSMHMMRCINLRFTYILTMSERENGCISILSAVVEFVYSFVKFLYGSGLQLTNSDHFVYFRGKLLLLSNLILG